MFLGELTEFNKGVYKLSGVMEIINTRNCRHAATFPTMRFDCLKAMSGITVFSASFEFIVILYLNNM